MNDFDDGFVPDEVDDGFIPDSEAPKISPVQDVVSNQLREQGYEPDTSEEFERLHELGTAEAMRGLFSGATVGFSEKVPGLETGENIASTTGKAIGSILPVSKLINIFQAPLVKFASSSPILAKQLTSLANITGVGLAGAAFGGAEQLAKGEVPNSDDLLEHGLEWAALDTGLSALGYTYRFGKSLVNKASRVGKDSYAVLNETLNNLKAAGEDFSQPDRVAAKAMEILEGPLTEAELAAERVTQAQPKQRTPEQTKVNEAVIKPAEKTEQVTPKDLSTKQVTKPIENLNNEAPVLSEPYLPENISFSKEAESLQESAITSQLENVGPKPVSKQEMGLAIRENIEGNMQADIEGYRPLYEEAEAAAGELQHIPMNTAREAGNRLQRLERLETKPPQYQATINQIENILTDVGYKVQRDKLGAIEQILQTRDVSVADSIELGRRINNMIDFETIDPNVKNILKPVVRAVKQDIRAGLAQNPDGLAAFELAEKEHARVAEKYGKDSIRKMRQTEAGERIANMSNTPTGYADIKEALTPEQMKQVEREFLEDLNSQSFEKAQKMLREMERHISKENQKLAREIVEAKNPHNIEGKKKSTQQAILTDMSNAVSNGTRPEKTLNLWKTPRGQKLVKDTFRDSPNKETVLEYLEKQSFNDMLASVMKKDGTLDIAKFKEFMKDPATVNNIRMLGGEEAVEFFKSLDSQVKQLERNVKILDSFPKESDIKRGKKILEETKARNAKKPKEVQLFGEKIGQKNAIEKESTGQQGKSILKRMAEKDFPVQAKVKNWKAWFQETMGLTPQGALSVFSLMKLGIPNAVANLIGSKLLYKLATNARVRKAFTEASKSQTDPLKFILAWENLDKIMQEESANEPVSLPPGKGTK